jgi:hypothetical protein
MPEDDVLKMAGQFEVCTTLSFCFIFCHLSDSLFFFRVSLISSGWSDKPVWFCLPHAKVSAV